MAGATDAGAAGGGGAASTFFVLAGRYAHATTDIGDVNGDGKLDLVNIGADAQVWLGRGDGTFSNDGVVSALGWTFTNPRYLGRFDMGDGADIASIEFLPNNAAFVGRFASGQADGTFRKTTTANTGGGQGEYFMVGRGDFTGDGFDDLLLVAGACGGLGTGACNPASAPTYYLATAFDPNHGPSFGATAGTVVPTPGGLATVFKTTAGGIGDVDGDGKLDFLLSTNSAWLGGAGAVQTDGYVVYGKSDGTFDERRGLSPMPLPVTPGQSAPDRLVDLDGDGRADGIYASMPSSVMWNDAGALTAAVSLPCSFREVGDFNGDGSPDLWGVSSNGTFVALPGDGHRGFGAPLASATLTGTNKSIATDVDKDGATDLIIVGASTTSIFLSTAKKPFAGPADVPCACTGPTGF